MVQNQNNSIPEIDILAANLNDNFDGLLVVVNDVQKVNGIKNTMHNFFTIKNWLLKTDIKWLLTDDNQFSIAFWNGNPTILKPNDYLIQYENGTFGFIAESEFIKTYNLPPDFEERKICNFKKKTICSNIMSANKHSKALCQWLDKYHCYYELSPNGISIASKESYTAQKELDKSQLQFVKYGENNYIMKDTSDGFYPKTKKDFDKLIVLSPEQIQQIKDTHKKEA